MFSKFFIQRPRFAVVISCILMIAGILCAHRLPIKQYPNIAPPQIMVMANYPGADAQTVANTVGIPLEEAINGVEGMIYMNSTSSNNGAYNLVVTFETGTNSDMALVKVQNKIHQATAQLPAIVNQMGITAMVSFSNMLAFVAVISPNKTRDALFLSDYAVNNVVNSLKRIPGMGSVNVMGAKYSVRIWLDPDKLSSMNMSPVDVSAAIQSQNKQAALGSIGSSPRYDNNTPIVYSLVAKGRLNAAEEFEDIIVKRSNTGAVVRLKDVARVELGSESYSVNSTYNGDECTVLFLSQGADANALDVMDGVKKFMEETKNSMPSDTAFEIIYDSTDFVRISIQEILETLALTFFLVVLVCYIFLQDWRVTLVPAAAIPVSLLATFISLAVLDYSINTFTLFGLVLVIGTVVDDAIVVVERVLYIMEHEGLDAKAATERAMIDVSGPMIATTLVFMAIFVPVAFMGGITSEIYKQFGVTMSFAVVCSTTVAFTLSPAMCAHMLTNIKPKTRGPLAWFNAILNVSTNIFVKISVLIARSMIVIILSLALVGWASYYIMDITPSEFIPQEDQGSLMGVIQLPEGASGARTSKFVSEIVPALAKIDGVKNNMGIEGFSFVGGAGENTGAFSLTLKDWDERKTPELSQSSIMAQANAITSKFPQAQVNIFAQGGVPGLGMMNGLEMKLQAVGRFDPLELEKVLQNFIMQINAAPEFMYAFSTYNASTPHIFLDVDRAKAESMGVNTGTIFDTLYMYLGTLYVNDINLGSQINRVMLQADWAFRNTVDDIGRLPIPNIWGEQVPVSSVVTLREITAPRAVSRFNLYPCADVMITLNPGYSSGQGIAKIQELSKTLPAGYAYQWSGQTYQEQREGSQFIIVITAAVLFGFLFLVAQYESWSIPFAVMLSLPVAILGALAGIYVMGITISVYTQLGLLLLVGLASKNAILIIEFAKEERELRGQTILNAAAEAARERFRSVLMTAFTCVLGALPMIFATGAGAASRLHVGTTMVFGMTVATVFGVFLIPGLFVLMQTFREKLKAGLARMFGHDDYDYNYDDDDEGDDDDDDDE
ncbi:MAG: efflux RND transporter permease subunit [Synergistaceae bacterium]|nr:efflux RND transporter permease subunit [Synergistaceae bacterium]